MLQGNPIGSALGPDVFGAQDFLPKVVSTFHLNQYIVLSSFYQ